MKNTLLFIITLITSSLSISAQVTSVDYLLDYNCETNLYEVKLKILDGGATSIAERAQFNAQITIVVPTGTSFDIVELVNPIQNNQNLDGTQPTLWNYGTPLLSPSADPAHDFYPIAPVLNPASFYNDLSSGDEPILFKCKIGTSSEYNSDYKFYDNDSEIAFTEVGAGNYSNGFTLGSPIQLYNGNDYKSCLTNTKENQLTDILVYPNPINNNIQIVLTEQTNSVSIVDITGKTMYLASNLSAEILNIDSEEYPSGTYIISIKSANTNLLKKIVKR